MENTKNRGFTSVETVLVLIILVIVGTVGWMVYKNNKDSDTKPVKTSKTASAPASTKKADPYAGWQSLCSKAGGLCLKYPADWKLSQTTYAEGESATGIEENRITSPSGKVVVNYLPTYEGPTGTGNEETITVNFVRQAASPEFEAISLTGNSGGTYRVESFVTTKAGAYVEQNSVKIQLTMGASASLSYGPTFSFTGFSNPKKPNDSTHRQVLAVAASTKDISPPYFDSSAKASAWLKSSDVQTAQKILASVSLIND